MSHPLVTGLEELSDEELSARIMDLTNKYYGVANPHVQNQMIMIIEDLQEEQLRRFELRKIEQSEEQAELDKLIRIS